MKIFRPLHFQKVWLSIGLTLVAAVIFLSLTASYPAYLVIGDDLKFNHILAYAVLMFYFAQLVTSTGAARFFAVLFVIMGIVLEYMQGRTGYRTFSYHDMLTDCIGVSFGLLASRTQLKNSVAYLDKKIAAFF